MEPCRSLYNLSVSAVVSSRKTLQLGLEVLTDRMKFDIYHKMFLDKRYDEVSVDFKRLEVFVKMLKVGDKRQLLHHCFQVLQDKEIRLSEILTYAFLQHCELAVSASDRDDAINVGFLLGGFLKDAGWFEDCEKIMIRCIQICESVCDVDHWVKGLECCVRMLHVQNAFCKFNDAQMSYSKAQDFVSKLRSVGGTPNLAALYSEFSLLFFVRSLYDEAYQWSIQAMKELTSSLPARTIVDVLRQAAKSCVVKREFKRAELLIRQAICLAQESFGVRHPKYSDALLDYGFYLLNVDCVSQSVQVYKMALGIRMNVFGGQNLHVAIAHEDLAYASYVNEYSTGKFAPADLHADKAMEIMCHLLPKDHLLLSSSKRVKALILEEIAIDNQDKVSEKQQLLEAQDLHLSALNLAKKAFGEMNVQTAKHYGNLGRLYQSMRMYEEAEGMHLKAIAVKEQLLGKEDYEVALSVGHLASLYNYDMGKYEEAKNLYLRSIGIGKNLFGEGYSGLEYDYRGLIRVYSVLENYAKINEFSRIYNDWKQIRDADEDRNKSSLSPPTKLFSVEEIVRQFFAMEPAIQNDFKIRSPGNCSS